VIDTNVIMKKRGIQWDRVQIRVLRMGLGPHKKIVLKMIGTMVIKEKRGIQRDRSQIIVLAGPLYSLFLYHCGLILRYE
jgi:hypothetical protein